MGAEATSSREDTEQDQEQVDSINSDPSPSSADDSSLPTALLNPLGVPPSSNPEPSTNPSNSPEPPTTTLSLLPELDTPTSLSQEIAQAEATSDAPRVARALSIYAGRRMAEAAERRIRAARGMGREQREEMQSVPPLPVQMGSSAKEGEEEIIAEKPQEIVRLEPAKLNPTERPGPSIDPEVQQEQVSIQEKEEEEEEESEDDSPAARAVPVDAHRRFAEAAERRMEEERRERDRLASSVVAAGVGSEGIRKEGLETLVEEESNEPEKETIEQQEQEEEHTPSATYALLFPANRRPFGSPVKQPEPSTASTSTATSAKPPSPPILSPPPQLQHQPAPIVPDASLAASIPSGPAPPSESSSPPFALAPPSAPTPPPFRTQPIPSTAFSDLASSFRPLPRPRAPTLNEMLNREVLVSDSSAQIGRPTLSAPSAPRRPPPLPPARPSSLYRDLPLPPPAQAGAAMLTHIPTGDRSSLPTPLHPSSSSSRPPPPAPPTMRPPSFPPQQGRRPAPPPPRQLPPGAAVSAFGPFSSSSSASNSTSTPPGGSADPTSRLPISTWRSPLPSRSSPEVPLATPSDPPPLARPAPPPPPQPPANRRRPLPVPPSPTPSSNFASSTQPQGQRVDAYTALRHRIEQREREQERERALEALEGRSSGEFGGRSSGEFGARLEVQRAPREGERPGSAASSFEVLGGGGEVSEPPEEQQQRDEEGGVVPPDQFAAYTDLDLLLARLEGDGRAEGTNYEVSFPAFSPLLGGGRWIAVAEVACLSFPFQLETRTGSQPPLRRPRSRSSTRRHGSRT